MNGHSNASKKFFNKRGEDLERLVGQKLDSHLMKPW